MLSFVDWLDTKGFYVKQVWDPEKETWQGAGHLMLFEHQRRILGHCLTPGSDGLFPYTTIVYSCPKKSGKTTLLAAIGAWYAEEGANDSEIYSLANDFEQAQARAFTDIVYHVEHFLGLNTTKARIDYPNGSFIQAIAQHYTSAAGSRQALTMWDELWGFVSERSQRMWAEMTIPPSVPNSFKVVTTYAGFETESDLLKDLYDQCFKLEEGQYVSGEDVPELVDIVDAGGRPVCRRNGKTFIYWDTEPRMPWQTEDYYETEMQNLRPSDFLRLHRNKWASSTDAFIPVEMWDRAAKKLAGPLTINQSSPYRHFPISVGIDIGLKHDCSALIGVYYDYAKGKVGIAFHNIWQPKKGEILDLEETVEGQLLAYWKAFRLNGVCYDPMQFQRSAVTLKKRGLPMIEYPQTPVNMTGASAAFYNLLKTNNLEAYPDDELRDHIRYAVAETTGRGFRIVKQKHAKFMIDAAVALAMACHYALSQGGMDVTSPINLISNFSDISSVHIATINELEAKLPEPLRSVQIW